MRIEPNRQEQEVKISALCGKIQNRNMEQNIRRLRTVRQRIRMRIRKK